MTDFETLLLSEQKNPNATVLEFLNTEYTSRDIVVFVEGINDPQFYYDFLRSYEPQRDIKFFTCDGKASLKIVKHFLQSYDLAVKPYKILYLSDQDFGAILKSRDTSLFETKFYSIESYFAAAEYVEYLMMEYVPTKIKQHARNKVLNFVRRDLLKLSNHMLAPMALLCVIRKSKIQCDFDGLNVNHFFALGIIDTDIRPARGRIDLLLQALKICKAQIPKMCLRDYVKQMQKLEFRYWVRGKLALQLLKISLRRISIQLSRAHQDALHSLMQHIGVGSLSQSYSFLKELPELNEYFVSV